MASSDFGITSPLGFLPTPSSAASSRGTRGPQSNRPQSNRPNLGDAHPNRNERNLLNLENGSGEVIWGTDVDTAVVRRVFHEFLTTWVPNREQWDALETVMDLDPQLPLYKQYLIKITLTGKPFLELNGKHLKSFNSDLYRWLIHEWDLVCAQSTSA